MAFDVKSDLRATVRLLSTEDDLVEITAFAKRFNLQVSFEPTFGKTNDWTASLVSPSYDFVHNDIMRLVLLRAIASGSSVEDVLNQSKQDIARLGINIETAATAREAVSAME